MTQQASAGRDSYVAGRDQYLVVDSTRLDSSARRDGARNTGGYDRERPVFVQYLNPEIRACYGRRYHPRDAHQDLAEALHATRLAILCTEGPIVIPASYLFEVPIMPRFLQAVELARHAGCVQYVSHIPDVDSYAEYKAIEYRSDARNPYARRIRRSMAEGLVWRPRVLSSAAGDISEDWKAAIAGYGALAPAVLSLAGRRETRFGDAESMLQDIPERLGGQAFVGRFVRAAMPVALTPEESFGVDMFLSRSYLRSYLLDLDAVIIADFSFGDLSCGVGRISDMEWRVLSARHVDAILRYIGIYDLIHRGDRWADILTLRDSPDMGIVVHGAFDRARRDLVRHAAARARKRYASSAEVSTIGDAITRVEILSEEIIACRGNYQWDQSASTEGAAR
jgi:hypothetical protein